MDISPIDLHLVSWNRPKMTELVIRTIRKNTKFGTYRLHVLDNGSDYETMKMLERLQEEDLIHNVRYISENGGLEWARQTMFKYDTYSQYFIDMDNDCLPPPTAPDQLDWLERLTELMKNFEEYAAIACRTQVMIGTGNIFEDELSPITDFPHPGGSIRIMRTHMVHHVGGWDREAPGRGSEERYICGKLRDQGYKTGFATHIPTLHLFGTRGDNGTDRWGYANDLLPEATGHSDISHPALTNGDDYEEVVRYAGTELAMEYFR